MAGGWRTVPGEARFVNDQEWRNGRAVRWRNTRLRAGAAARGRSVENRATVVSGERRRAIEVRRKTGRLKLGGRARRGVRQRLTLARTDDVRASQERGGAMRQVTPRLRPLQAVLRRERGRGLGRGEGF